MGNRSIMIVFLFLPLLMHALDAPEIEYRQGEACYSVVWHDGSAKIENIVPQISINGKWVSVSEFSSIDWRIIEGDRISVVDKYGDSHKILTMSCSGHPMVEECSFRFELVANRPFVVMDSYIEAKNDFSLGGVRLISSGCSNMTIAGKPEEWLIFNESVAAPHCGVMMHPDQLNGKKANSGRFSKGHTGVWVSMLANDSEKESFGFASISAELWPNNFKWSQPDLDYSGHLNIEVRSGSVNGLESLRMSSGVTIRTDPFLLGYWRDIKPVHVLAEIGEVMGINVRKGVAMKRPEAGWSSWHTYDLDIDKDIICGAADFVSKELASYGWKNIQIDAGWWTEAGLFYVNDGFCDGIREVSDYVVSKGLDFGLHVSPLRTHPEEPMILNNPDMMLKPYVRRKVSRNDDEMVTTIGTEYYDVTHPYVAPFVAGRFQQMAEDYKPVFMKLDHHYGALEEGERFDSSMTALQGHNLAIRMMRDCLPDTMIITRSMEYLLGANECCDAMRVGQDINTPGIKSDSEPYTNITFGHTSGDVRDFNDGKGLVRLARSVAQNFYIHNNIAICDPDAFFVSPQYSMDEAKCHMTLVAIMGGLFFNGDKIECLPEERLSLLKNEKIIEVNKAGVHAVPLDLFSGADVPRIWKLEADGKLYVTVFNWLDEPVRDIFRMSEDFEMDDSRAYAFSELWTDECVDVKGTFRLQMEPHSVKIFEINEL